MRDLDTQVSVNFDFLRVHSAQLVKLGAKAFCGELVPQVPNDEPASVLLERIRSQCAETVVPKAKRGRKPKASPEPIA